MSVVIPDEILQASQLSSSEFRQEIALHLFQTDRLTLGYALASYRIYNPTPFVNFSDDVKSLLQADPHYF